MIQLITGTPGAGKTYLAVTLLTEKYFNWDKKEKKFVKKEKYKDFEIVTNIDGLELPHFSLNEIFEKRNLSFDRFFTVPFQESIKEKMPNIVYVIDECQQYIDTRFGNKEVIYYFDYHRHFGHDIFLITQDAVKICRQIAVLAEFEYRAVKRTFSLFGEFRYNIKSNGEIFERKTIRQNKRIFDLYRSFNEGGEQTKKRNPLFKVLVFMILFFLFCGWMFFRMITPDPVDASTKPVSGKKEVMGSQQPKNATVGSGKKTFFADEMPPGEKPKYSTVKLFLPLRDIIVVDGAIYKFRDLLPPHKLIPMELASYPIKHINGSFYAHFSESDYHEYLRISEFRKSLYPTQSRPESEESGPQGSPTLRTMPFIPDSV